jgi:hypothetical protein
MADYPLTQALIVELCGLGPNDQELPLQVLVNLHRPQLRRPLEGLAMYAVTQPVALLDDSERTIVFHLDENVRERYPALQGGELYASSSTIQQLSSMAAWQAGANDYPEPTSFRDLPTIGAVFYELKRRVFDGWEAYDPLLFLYALTFNGPMEFGIAAQTLELQLGLHAQVGQFIRDMASQ